MFGTGSMLIIGRSFVRVSEVQNQREAEFRYALTRLRENGESIALLGGEKEERAELSRNFCALLESWRMVMGQWMRTTFVSSTSGFVAAVLPILLCAPKFLAGDMTLGQVMQAASAFVIVQTAFGWLVDNYPRFANWNANARRIASLVASLDALEEAEKAGGIKLITRGQHDENGAAVARAVGDASTTAPASCNEAEVDIAPGEKVLIVGELRHRQEHAGARDRRALAVGRRPGRDAARLQAADAAAEGLCAARLAAPRHHLSAGRRRGEGRGRHATRSKRSGSAICWIGWTRKRPGSRRCRAARSSASPSRGSSSTSPT